MRAEGCLVGKAVVVTGAGRGLGQAFARDVAREGAAVVVNEIDEGLAQSVVDGILAEGGRAHPLTCSVAERDGADALISGCLEKFGRCDGLVNNAGRFAVEDSGHEDEAILRAIVETNLLGVLFCGGAAIRHFRDAGSGAIVNLTSNAYLGLTRMAAYAATKGAAVSLTYSWAEELAGTNIRVNALAPRAATRMSAVRNDASKFPNAALVAPIVSTLLSPLAAGISGEVFGFDGSTLVHFGRPQRSMHEIADSAPDPGHLATMLRALSE
jgi:NAD(P)-dependent dehydrogenase (short-subunit alcohol dehydrogenase family)